MVRQFVTLAVVSMFCTSVLAEDKASQQKDSVRGITPIFSQLVSVPLPKGFVPAFEDTKGGQYIQEWVLQGENLKKWSQMITLTGSKGLALNVSIPPARIAGGIADGFKRACPDSHTATALGAKKFGNHDGFAAVVSCGIANPVGEPYSESALLIVIKGDSDYYSIQWAERGAASKTPIAFDNAKWGDRLKKLSTIKLCPIVAGESPPYPSCLNRM
jgi:hypothetical protein